MADTVGALRKIPFSAKAFGLGLGVAAMIYLALGVYLAMNGAATIAKRQEKLASQTIAIERAGHTPPPPAEPAEQPHEMFGPPEPGVVAETPPPVMPPETVLAETPPAAEIPTATQPATTPLETAPPKTIPEITLPAVPIDGLYEDTADGRLPVIRKNDKLTPFNAYKRPFKAPAPGVPVISIVVMDLGISDNGTQAALNDLPPDVSVAINSYASNPDFWSNEARTKGHETWIEMPVESDLYPLNDSGPQTLLINAVEKQNLNKLNWTLSRTSGYAGVITGYQPALMKSDSDSRPILKAIYSRGLGFVDGEPQPTEMGELMAEETNSPYAHNNIWIDIPPASDHIAVSLRQLEVLAQGNGSAVGFIHTSPISLKMLQSWLKTLPEKGIVLAPLSAQTDIKPK
ncbi:MAG TPA: divergent polysaccharide deacetylase family protein [Micavibrio sp.]|jgi:hypothetical protein